MKIKDAQLLHPTDCKFNDYCTSSCRDLNKDFATDPEA